MLQKIINWQDPLQTAYSLSLNFDYKESWIFLYSGLNNEIENSYSYLALYPNEEIIADDFKEFEEELAKAKNKEKWFGYLGYGLKNSLEELPKDQKSFINLPNLWMVNFKLILIFDHQKQKIIVNYDNEDLLNKIPRAAPIKFSKDLLGLKEIKSNFTKEQYLQKLNFIKERIKEGDLYQANLTRKFFTYLEDKKNNRFDLFLKLNKSSPGNFSSFLKLGKNYIISSTPELFLKVDKNGSVISSPIKGTTPRFSDLELDNLSKENLKNSDKERGENLMIVDLVRNDLSRSCKIDSIKVKNLFKITSYKTIHHMSSDICGIKRNDVSALEVVKNCFPPGSMTGAPKIKAMGICSDLEKAQRGIYSGAIGFFEGNESCNLSVVIRTIIIEDDKIPKLEFQVGGAITFDSNSESEWQETINKAKGIANALQIKLDALKDL